MRWLAIPFLMFAIATAQAQGLSQLRAPGVNWQTAKAMKADVTCDGKSDTIVFGTAKNSVWVGILPGNGGKPQTMQFGLRSHSQDGFCAEPKRITTSPIDCAAAADGLGIKHLPGCKPVKACRVFSVDDEECDPFNFYWDSRHKLVRWWRN